MGGDGKGRGGGWSGKGRGGGPSWIERTRDRLESHYAEDIGDSDTPVPPAASLAVRRRAEQIGGSRPPATGVWARPADAEQGEELDTVEPVATVTAEAAHNAALQSHRKGAGRRASGFEPQRNTFFISGRPTQVTFQTNKKAYVLDGATSVAHCFKQEALPCFFWVS